MPTLVLGALWAALMAGITWLLPARSLPLVVLSLAFPLYYLVLSLVLHARRRARRCPPRN